MKTQFALNLQMEYRRVGTDLWLSGSTEKMGATEVLFRAIESIELQSQIEMVFRMPVSDPCNLVCNGTVLKVEMPFISATIERYSFVRI